MTGTADDGPERPELSLIQGGHDGASTSMGRAGLELPISIILRGSPGVDLFLDAMTTADTPGPEKTRLERVLLALDVVARTLVDTAADQAPPEVVVDFDEHGDPKQGLISVFVHKPPLDRPRSS